MVGEYGQNMQYNKKEKHKWGKGWKEKMRRQTEFQ